MKMLLSPAYQHCRMLVIPAVCLSIILVTACESLAVTVDNDSSGQLDGSSRDLGGRLRLKEKPSLHTPFFDRDSILPLSDGKGPHCRSQAKCEPLHNATCLGMKLPYSSTTGALVGLTQEQIQEELQFWMALQHIPRCWAVIQPVLCALYMPRCDNDHVDLPSPEICKMASGPCKILELQRGWKSPLRCDNTTRFPPQCKNDVREMRFNTSAQCLAPLVPTDNPAAFFEGIEGCGLQCANPMFTPDEHRQNHVLNAWAGGTSIVFILFTVASFLIDWRSANKYPAVIIFYFSCCFLVAYVGFLAQFLPGAREGIVCRKDGTLRMSEPSAGENLSCVIVFVLIYYFLMAACVWFVILAYAWHLSFQALGKIQDRIDKKGAYFHLVAWSLPLVLTITTMAIGEIDGNSEVGICFVGYMNPAARGGLLLGPVAILYLAGAYFLLRGLITLIKVKTNSHDIISERASAKIRETIVRMGFFTLFTFLIVVATFVVHIDEFHHRRSWRESFRTFMICKIMRSGGVTTGMTGHSDCRMEVRPSLAMVQLHILVLFTAGVVMSSWVWTASTVDTWIRFLKRSFNQDDDEPVKMKKHKVIAQVFAKRQAFNRAGRISISFHSTHDDPVGLNFELNSVASKDMSTTWAAALPNFVTRRGALIATGSISSQYRNSLDSDFSHGVRRVSLESRRQSIDSQLSLALGEFTASRKAGSTPVPPLTSLGVSGGRVKSRHKRKKYHCKRSRIGFYNRRGSTTSQESQLGAKILSTLAMGNSNIPSLVPNLKRRTGNAGLNEDQILPSALTSRGMFGFHVPSDVTDDDVPELRAIALPHEKGGKEIKGAAVKLESQKNAELQLENSMKIRAKIQDQSDCDVNDRVGRGSKSSGKHRTHNGRRSRDLTVDSTSLSSDLKYNGRVSAKNGEMNGEKTKNFGNSKDRLSDNGVDDNFKLLNSKELKQGSSSETKTHLGKKYCKVELDALDSPPCSDSENSLDSDEENEIGKVEVERKNSHPVNVELRKTPDGNCFMKGNLKPDDDLSDASSTSYSHELSCLAFKSSLSGVSTGPSKHVTVVSPLRHAREVGTQTSLSSGLNEIGNVENGRQKYSTPTLASHHSIPGITRTENVYHEHDITNNHSHNCSSDDSGTDSDRNIRKKL